MKNYEFKCKESSTIDMNRIANECEGVAFCIPCFSGSNETGKLLYVRKSFIKKFDTEEQVRLCGETLQNSWGNTPVLRVFYKRENTWFAMSVESMPQTEEDVQLSGEWRFRWTANSREEIEAQLTAAKKHLKSAATMRVCNF